MGQRACPGWVRLPFSSATTPAAATASATTSAQAATAAYTLTAADRRIKEARATDADALRGALEALAGLELASRGMADVSEDTAALRALATITA